MEVVGMGVWVWWGSGRGWWRSGKDGGIVCGKGCGGGVVGGWVDLFSFGRNFFIFIYYLFKIKNRTSSKILGITPIAPRQCSLCLCRL